MAYQDIVYVCLDELLALRAEVALVVTHPDPVNENIWFRSVADRARKAGLPVLRPPSVNAPDVVAAIAGLAPDFLFSFYFREIIGPEVLGLARRGALNLHGSLLPRYRGRCPVNWVLINGERETGVTLHYMEARPDRGKRLFVWWARPLDLGPRVGAPGEVVEIRPGAGVVVAAGSGALLLDRVQLAGHDEQRADELAVQTGLVMGERLGGDDAAWERA